MATPRILIPNFRSKQAIVRTTISLVFAALFLAAFEVGISNHENAHLPELLKQFYLHACFLLTSGVLIVVSFELLRSRIERLPRRWMLFYIWLLTIVMLCLATVLVNVVHELTNVLPWSNKRVIMLFFFHGFLGTILIGLAVHYIDIQQRALHFNALEWQSQVTNLENRMQPHFFFNSMNSLLYLVESQDPKATNMVEDMAAFFRVSLKPPQLVSVSQEIEICKRYLNIEKIRLADQFDVSWHVDNEHELYTAMIPSLTLQPVFEYLITEGSQFHTMSMAVHVRSYTEGKNELLEIAWHTPVVDDRNYIAGLETLLERYAEQLKQHFGSGANMFLQANKQNHTIGLVYPIKSVL